MSSAPIPRSEYPRPHLVREKWLNLNGTWEFAFDDNDQGLQESWQDGRELVGSILVPFVYQSVLSGIGDKRVCEVVWYARSFAVPEEWNEHDVLLHFGAVDYRCTVWVNGAEVGHNQGGHVPFSFNIAPYLHGGDNRLTVRVEDRQDPYQPRGKQSVSGLPKEVDYYNTTGIWQTVWMEPVPRMRIEDVRITPVAEEGILAVLTYLHAPTIGWTVKVTVSYKGEVIKEVESETLNAVGRTIIRLEHPKLWSPAEPNLYDIEIKLLRDGHECDCVCSYAGMRSVAIQGDKILINGKPTYLAMALDQGYWPESGITAPSDAALKADVEWAKQYGFNGVRKHQKIEDPRWLYWCDTLGLMVWGEMANAKDWSPRAEEMLIAEWERVVRRDYSHPCIIAWVPMNESWGVPGLRDNHPGQFAYLERIVSLTRRLDHSRPVIDNDGWEHTDITDICAIHDYTPTAEGLKNRYNEALHGGGLPSHMWLEGIPLFSRGAQHHGQPVMLTEVGGFLMVPQHIPVEERDEMYKFYASCENAEEMFEKYKVLMEGMAELKFISGFCYTQLTDVEHEINGLLTYDRQPKIEPEKIAELHQEVIRRYEERFESA